MIALLLCGIIAGACAAPQFNEFPFKTPQRRPSFFNFDNFMSGFMSDFSRGFPTIVPQEGVEGTEYKITISLPDFEEQDIVVKARERLLMIEANHKDLNIYMYNTTLPDTVNLNGNWNFEHGVLKITFPLKDGVKDGEVAAVTEQEPELDTTVRPYFEESLEEIETNITPAPGEYVAALYPPDNNWYRARVLSVTRADQSVEVMYMDYGTVLWVKEDQLRMLEPRQVTLPMQAIRCVLAGVRARSHSSQQWAQAKRALTDMVQDKTLDAHVIARDYDEITVELFDEDGYSIAEQLAANDMVELTDYTIVDDASVTKKIVVP
ncbi:hypothetical protein PYW07_017298 [Mythimna separata]|uniref:Tudor domain-containing protein n=1 Tax=Mythimna separata TaxID=271217 RepID=A0AAD7YYD3_MYTSE|nr:hypothetical protein PYW07_017298 [Mythimna separata]